MGPLNQTYYGAPYPHGPMAPQPPSPARRGGSRVPTIITASGPASSTTMATECSMPTTTNGTNGVHAAPDLPLADHLEGYNYAFLDELSKKAVRRALLKGVAIPGYQVPF